MLELVREHKMGRRVGIASVCSAHPQVIEASLRVGRERGEAVLIEATSNQVNQFGGYTGLTPGDFRAQVEAIAARVGLPPQDILLGGDHLGPNAWQAQPPQIALTRAADMVAAYVRAGFRKIHLDCSMSCAGDPQPLPDAIVAARSADLCAVAEQAWRETGGEAPVYVIGTEVPVPGGAAEALGALAVTETASVDATLEAHRRAFEARGLAAVWPRIVAMVVQPGVEFDHDKVVDYEPAKARALSRRIESEPGMVFEAHSTDYQRPAMLRALVQDHFAILKVGPAATFALRETLWGLSQVATQWLGPQGPTLPEVVLAAMREDPRHWKAYYENPARETFDLQYSLSDRIRYYWAVPRVQAACEALLARLRTGPMPLALLSQFLPEQFEAIREGRLANEPDDVLRDGVARVLRHYARACRPDAAAA
jgi:D-tagatose-1,6-bisphosphate aldolase subunit GatZ/KbaZ